MNYLQNKVITGDFVMGKIKEETCSTLCLGLNPVFLKRNGRDEGFSVNRGRKCHQQVFGR